MSDQPRDRLEERLVAIAPELPGRDWLDVRRRARRPARSRLLVAAAAAALVLVVAVPALGLDERLLGFLGVAQTQEDVPAVRAGAQPVPYVYGRTVYGLGAAKRLAAPLRPVIVGEAPVTAVPSPDGRYLGYHAADGATPILRVLDLRTGRDRLLARGAHLLAWGEGGLAYFQAVRREYAERRAFAGRVVVRATPESEPVTWVRGVGMYSVVAWARRGLVIASHGCNLPVDDRGSSGPFCPAALAPGTYVLDGPGRARSLGDHSIAAISPDGRLGFGAVQPPDQDSPTRLAHVVDLATGRRVATLDLARAGTRARLFVAGDVAAWAGDTIAVVGVGAPAQLLVLRFAGGDLRFRAGLRLPPRVFAGTHGANFSTPVFADADGRRVVVRASAEYRGPREGGVRAFLTCDLRTRTCRMGRPLRHGASLGVVFNPSRPAPPLR